MQITDYTTLNGRASLQKLRYLVARAVSASMDNAAKNAWLSAVLGGVIIDVTADEPWSRDSLDTDQLSNNTRPDLIAALTRAASEASTHGGDYKTQLLQDLNDADTILTA